MVDGSNASLFPQYNYAQAGQYPDPGQWSNPYTSFGGPGQMPGWPTQYAGAPVNAGTGQPIQLPASQPGMTLNSSPGIGGGSSAAPSSNPFAGIQVPQGQNTAVAQPFGGLNSQQWQALTPQQRGPAQAAMQEYQAGVAATPSDSFVASGNNPKGGGPGMGAYLQGAGYDAFNQMQQGAQQAAPQMQPSQPNSYQNALSLLANPGNPVTPGAPFTAAQSQAGGGPQGQGILNNFIKNWQQGGIGQQAAPGLGGGSSGVSFGANNPFFAALGGQK